MGQNSCWRQACRNEKELAIDAWRTIGTRDLVESLDIACLVIDDSFSVLEANRKAGELVALDTLAGMTLDVIFTAGDIEMVRDGLERCRSGPRSFVASVLQGHGGWFLGDFVATRHDDDLGCGFFVLTVREHCEAEDAARGAEIHRLLLDSSLDAIVAHTLEGDLLYANPAYRERAGLCATGLSGRELSWCWIGDPESAPTRMGQLFRHGQARFEIEAPPSRGGYVQEVFARLTDSPEGPIILASIRDISERVRTERIMQHLAFHDPLTGLPNRIALEDALARLTSHSDRYDEQVGLIFIDLNDFKPINDTYGHVAGDRVLQAIGSRLERALRETDTVARYGGDEFVVVLPKIEDAEALENVSAKLAAEIARPISIPSGEVSVQASFGTAIRNAGESTESLLARADFRMYENRGQTDEDALHSE